MALKYLTLLGLIVLTHTLAAQDSELFRYPALPYVRQAEPWLDSRNAAGLTRLPLVKISTAEVFASCGKGDFTDYYQSDDHYEWGAASESYFRLNPRVTLYGQIRYSQFTGRNMVGSAFIDPTYQPFDLSEMADSTRGVKNKETFLLSGGVGVNLGRGFSLGGQIDYRTAHYAKYRDLRHTNKQMALTGNTGLAYRWMPGGGRHEGVVGASYIYRRSIEGLSFNRYGTSDRQYYTLVNFGSFYGNSELWNTSGSKSYTIDGKPLFDDGHGGALQAGFFRQDRWRLFAEVFYLTHKGYYGKESPHTYVFTRHNGRELSAGTVMEYFGRAFRHALRLRATQHRLENYEMISYEDTQGSRTTIIYTGKNLTTNRETWTYRLDYTGAFGLRNFTPAWQLRAGADYTDRRRQTTLYPYYRRQVIGSYNCYVGLDRHIGKGKQLYTFSLTACYGAGNGTPKDDGVYTTPSAQQKPPQSLDHLLYQEYNYLTAQRLTAQAAVEYARTVRPALCAFVRLAGEGTYASKNEISSKKTYIFASLSAGCRF
jgi:hypothetical protein